MWLFVATVLTELGQTTELAKPNQHANGVRPFPCLSSPSILLLNSPGCYVEGSLYLHVLVQDQWNRVLVAVLMEGISRFLQMWQSGQNWEGSKGSLLVALEVMAFPNCPKDPLGYALCCAKPNKSHGITLTAITEWTP